MNGGPPPLANVCLMPRLAIGLRVRAIHQNKCVEKVLAALEMRCFFRRSLRTETNSSSMKLGANYMRTHNPTSIVNAMPFSILVSNVLENSHIFTTWLPA